MFDRFTAEINNKSGGDVVVYPEDEVPWNNFEPPKLYETCCPGDMKISK
jgi:hypothetical protein